MASGANPKIVSYNATVVKSKNTSRLVCFKTKMSSTFVQKTLQPVAYNASVVVVNATVVGWALVFKTKLCFGTWQRTA
jgi:hypothetical protein